MKMNVLKKLISIIKNEANRKDEKAKKSEEIWNKLF